MGSSSGPGFAQFGFADTRRAFRQDGLAQFFRQKDDGCDLLRCDVLLASQCLAHSLYRFKHRELLTQKAQ